MFPMLESVEAEDAVDMVNQKRAGDVPASSAELLVILKELLGNRRCT